MCYKIFFKNKTIGIGFASYLTVLSRREPSMSPFVKEFAAMNLLVIWLLVLVGFVFLKLVKKRMED